MKNETVKKKGPDRDPDPVKKKAPDTSIGKKRKENFFFTEKDGFVSGFYSDNINVVPKGAKPISNDTRLSSLESEQNGKVLSVVEDGIVPVDPIPDPVVQAKAYVRNERAEADRQIRYHEDSDTRSTATERKWRDYRKALRDYVRADKIVGIKPIRIS